MSLYSQRLCRVFGLFLLSFLLLGLVRLEFLLWNQAQFAGQGFEPVLRAILVGMRFDLAASAWLTAPILLLTLVPWPSRWEKLWRTTVFAVVVLIHVPFLIVNLIDIEFVNYVGRRMTADVLFILGEAQGKGGGFLSAFIGLFVVAFVTLALQVGGAWRILRWAPHRPGFLPTGRMARGLFAFLLFLGAVVASRGGFQKKPVSFVDANVFAAPVLNNLVLNTSFNILKNLGQENLPRVRYFEDRNEMLKHLNGTGSGPSLLEGLRPRPPQNVVVLMLESFALDYMGWPNNRPGWTPFLDSLAQRSLFFRNGFANGRRSIEGVAAVMAGIPAMMNEPFITSPFTANRFIGLGSLLTAQGYQTAFFHGGNNGTMHFDSFMQSTGIAEYWGAREYPDAADNDGVWGIYDGPFLEWTRQQIGRMRTPFFASFFSLSSHQPYLIPPAERDRFPEGPLPILKTISYTDDVLRRFFEAASKESWYKDTLFVIVADHSFVPTDPLRDGELSRDRIPILFFHPSFQWPAAIDREQIVQQIDVLPSIADFLGLKMPDAVALGRSVFVPGERTATLFLDGNYLLVAKDHVLRRNRDGAVEMFAAGDELLRNPVETPAERKAELETRLKASIQYFSEGMWDNRLYAPTSR